MLAFAFKTENGEGAIKVAVNEGFLLGDCDFQGTIDGCGPLLVKALIGKHEPSQPWTLSIY